MVKRKSEVRSVGACDARSRARGRGQAVLAVCVVVALTLCGEGRGAQRAPGAKTRFHWAGWQIPASKIVERGALVIESDEAAQSEREVEGKEGAKKKEKTALTLRVSRRAIAKSPLGVCRTPFLKWGQIVPGVYKVRARIKYVGDEGLIGTPITLTVEEQSRGVISRDFYSFDIGKPGEYSEISFLYEVDPTGTKRLKARRARHSWGYAAYLPEEYPGAKNLPQYQPKAPPVQPGINIYLGLPKTKYSSATGMPPNSLRSVSVDWIAMEKIDPSPSITVRYVRAQKRWMHPGDKTSFETALTNFSDKPWQRTFVLTLIRGIDERTVLDKQDVSLKPGETKKIVVPWQTAKDTPIWGYEVRAEVRDGEKTDYSARDFFAVHPRVYAVHIMGTRFRTVDPFREQSRCNNLVEVFAATPGDCAGPMPVYDQWLEGMSTVAATFKVVRNATRHNEEMGVATHMYLFAGGTGVPIMDLYVRKPQWFSSRLNATDQVYRATKSTGDQIREHDFNTGPFEMPKTPHVEQHLNHFFPELMQRITTQCLQFIEKTGYEGIRFDVGIFAPKSARTVFGQKLDRDPSKMMEYAANNFNTFRAAIMKKFPQFEWGANMDSWAYLEHVGNRNNPDPPAPEKYPEFVAFAKAHGMFMDEGTMSAPLFGHYMNRYEDALWGMCRKRTVARKYGGYYQLFSPHRDGAGHFCHDDVYWATLIVASGSYYVGHYSAMPYSQDSVGHFITRYHEYFHGMNLVPIPEAGDKIYVDAPSELWYANTAVWEDVGNKRRYVIPLINPPVTERFRRNKTNRLPPPIKDPFNIEIEMPDGYRTAKAWMLTWEPRIGSAPLKATVRGGKCTVVFPGIQLFRTLVVEFEK